MKKGRVLLADSHLGMLGGVHSLLNELFEAVVMVADERSLEEAVPALLPDVVIVDLSLSREGEANVVLRLLHQHPRLRLIVLSVHDEPAVARKVLGTGAAGYVLKRAAAAELVAAVRAVLEGGTYVCAELRDPPVVSPRT